MESSKDDNGRNEMAAAISNEDSDGSETSQSAKDGVPNDEKLSRLDYKHSASPYHATRRRRSDPGRAESVVAVLAGDSQQQQHERRSSLNHDEAESFILHNSLSTDPSGLADAVDSYPTLTNMAGTTTTTEGNNSNNNDSNPAVVVNILTAPRLLEQEAEVLAQAKPILIPAERILPPTEQKLANQVAALQTDIQRLQAEQQQMEKGEQEEEEQLPPPPETARERFCRNKNRRSLCLCYGIPMALSVAVIVVVVLVRGQPPSPTAAPAAGDTMAPTASPTGPLSPEQREEDMIKHLSPVAGRSPSNNATSIHSSDRALAWLLEEDPLRLTTSSDHLIQRFAILDFHFGQDNGVNLLESSDSIGYHECDYEKFNFWVDQYVCDAPQGNVIRLRLKELNVHGTLPYSLGYLSMLTAADLHGNPIEGTIPTSLGLLTHLKELKLSLTLLTGTIPDVIGNLTHLTVLYLQGNRFTGTIPSTLKRLVNLKQAFFYDNPNVTGAVPFCDGDNATIVPKTLVADCARVRGGCPCCSNCCPQEWDGLLRYNGCAAPSGNNSNF